MAQFNIYYSCPECGTEWSDTHSCACNGQCPECGVKDIEPNEYEDTTTQRDDFRNDLIAVAAKAFPGLTDDGYLAIAEAILYHFESSADSVESLFNIDEDEDKQLQAVPMPWL
jgi:hypothetical protein